MNLEDKIQQELAEQRMRASAITGQSQQVEKSFDNYVYDLIEKGEGDRGGVIIGHTKSGKPIYQDHKNESHKNFTSQEHKEAADLHSHLASHSDSRDPHSKIKNQMSYEHHYFQSNKKKGS